MKVVGAVLATCAASALEGVGATECATNVYQLPSGKTILDIGTAGEVTGPCDTRGELKMNGATGQLVYCDTTWKSLGGFETRITDLENRQSSLATMGMSSAVACTSGTIGNMFFDTESGGVVVCNGEEYTPMAGTPGCSAGDYWGESCTDVMQKCKVTENTYITLKGRSDAMEGLKVYCDMETTEGPYVRIFQSEAPTVWGSNWESANTEIPAGPNYSILGHRNLIGNTGTRQKYRFATGAEGNNDDCTRGCDEIVWSQTWDMFTQRTDGAGYQYIAGNEPSACNGFEGFHKYPNSNVGVASDPSTLDQPGCWWHQVVPTGYHASYCSTGMQWNIHNVPQGYLQSFAGTNANTCHLFQAIYMNF